MHRDGHSHLARHPRHSRVTQPASLIHQITGAATHQDPNVTVLEAVGLFHGTCSGSFAPPLEAEPPFEVGHQGETNRCGHHVRHAASAPFGRPRFDTQFENRHELESIAELTHLPKGGTVMVQRARRIVSVLRVGYKRSADSRHIVELLEPVTLGTACRRTRRRTLPDRLPTATSAAVSRSSYRGKGGTRCAVERISLRGGVCEFGWCAVGCSSGFPAPRRVNAAPPGNHPEFRTKLSPLPRLLPPLVVSRLDESATAFLTGHGVRAEPLMWQPGDELFERHG